MNLFTDGFKETLSLRDFTINCLSNITFDSQSFEESRVSQIALQTNGAISFGQQSFEDCEDLKSLVIKCASNVTFGVGAFDESEIQELKATWTSKSNSMTLLDEANSTITFMKESFKECNRLTVNVDAKGNVNFEGNSFKNSKSLSQMNVHEHAFAGCSSLQSLNVDAPQKDVSDCALGSCKKKLKLSGGAIAGIVIACIVVAAVIFCCVWFLVVVLRKYHAEEHEPPHAQELPLNEELNEQKF